MWLHSGTVGALVRSQGAVYHLEKQRRNNSRHAAANIRRKRSFNVKGSGFVLLTRRISGPIPLLNRIPSGNVKVRLANGVSPGVLLRSGVHNVVAAGGGGRICLRLNPPLAVCTEGRGGHKGGVGRLTGRFSALDCNSPRPPTTGWFDNSSLKPSVQQVLAFMLTDCSPSENDVRNQSAKHGPTSFKSAESTFFMGRGDGGGVESHQI